MMNVLLTGVPRIGKTTLIKKVVQQLGRCAGFYTEEIRERNSRVGFQLITLDGQQCTMSHKKARSPHRIGRYYVDRNCIDRLGVTALEEGIEKKYTLVIDEIGKMELFSDSFKKVVLRALDSDSPVLGSILLRAHPFCDRIKQRNDVRVISVSEENRDGLSVEIVRALIP
jgi:nucleoside-triphosphatase THEP1